MNPVVKVNLWCFHLSLFSRNPRPDSGEARLPSLHQRSPLSSRSSGSLSTQVQPPRSRKAKKLEFLFLQTASASNGISLNVLSKTNDRDSNDCFWYFVFEGLVLFACVSPPLCLTQPTAGSRLSAGGGAGPPDPPWCHGGASDQLSGAEPQCSVGPTAAREESRNPKTRKT